MGGGRAARADMPCGEESRAPWEAAPTMGTGGAPGARLSSASRGRATRGLPDLRGEAGCPLCAGRGRNGRPARGARLVGRRAARSAGRILWQTTGSPIAATAVTQPVPRPSHALPPDGPHRLVHGTAAEFLMVGDLCWTSRAPAPRSRQRSCGWCGHPTQPTRPCRDVSSSPPLFPLPQRPRKIMPLLKRLTSRNTVHSPAGQCQPHFHPPARPSPPSNPHRMYPPRPSAPGPLRSGSHASS